MNPRLTRNELLRRGAAGGALSDLPVVARSVWRRRDGGGSADGGELKDVLNFANWPFYIDTEKPHPSLEQFTAKTESRSTTSRRSTTTPSTSRRCRARWRKARASTATSSSFTDNSRFPGLLVAQGWVQQLDKELIPNIANLDRRAGEPAVRPGAEVLAAVAVRDGPESPGTRTSPGPSRRSTQLLEDPKLKGKVYDADARWRTRSGLVILDNGDDPATVTDETFDRALDRVQAAVDSGQIRRFTGNDYAQPLATGDLAASWPGPVTSSSSSRTTRSSSGPSRQDGGIIWTDNMLIPTGGSVPTASTYMNFVYDPAVAATDRRRDVNYMSPVKGVEGRAASKIDPDVARNS